MENRESGRDVRDSSWGEAFVCPDVGQASACLLYSSKQARHEKTLVTGHSETDGEEALARCSCLGNPKRCWREAQKIKSPSLSLVSPHHAAAIKKPLCRLRVTLSLLHFSLYPFVFLLPNPDKTTLSLLPASDSFPPPPLCLCLASSLPTPHQRPRKRTKFS